LDFFQKHPFAAKEKKKDNQFFVKICEVKNNPRVWAERDSRFTRIPGECTREVIISNFFSQKRKTVKVILSSLAFLLFLSLESEFLIFCLKINCLDSYLLFSLRKKQTNKKFEKKEKQNENKLTDNSVIPFRFQIDESDR
jgi:hypothetical protein